MSQAAAPVGRLPLPRVWAFGTGSIPVFMLLLGLGTYITSFYAGTGAIKPGEADSMPKLAWALIAVALVAIPINAIFTPERVVRDLKPQGASFADIAKIFTTGSMSRVVLADLLLTLGANTTAPMYVF